MSDFLKSLVLKLFLVTYLLTLLMLSLPQKFATKDFD